MLRILTGAVVAMVVVSALPAKADGFCAGFQSGYEAGSCYGNVYCLPPIPPICPLPQIGEYGYQAGYNRGFLAGVGLAGRAGGSAGPYFVHPQTVEPVYPTYQRPRFLWPPRVD